MGDDMDSPIRLVGFPPSPFYQTAALCLAEKGIAFDRVTPMDPGIHGENAAHPFRKIPSLHHGEIAIHESLAIACYVDCAFDGPSIIPTTCEAKARAFEWVSNYLDYGVRSVLRFSVQERFQKRFHGLAADEELIAANKPSMLEYCAVLDAHLKRFPWLSGDQFSIAEMFQVPALHYFSATPEGQDILTKMRHVCEWLNRCHQRSTVTEVCGVLTIKQ